MRNHPWFDDYSPSKNAFKGYDIKRIDRKKQQPSEIEQLTKEVQELKELLKIATSTHTTIVEIL